MTPRARTDRHRNPTAFTTALAKQAGLQLSVDYNEGDSFIVAGKRFFTARLLGDPMEITLRLLDRVGFYTKTGTLRWKYIGIPAGVWAALSPSLKRVVVIAMYRVEGGTEMVL